MPADGDVLLLTCWMMGAELTVAEDAAAGRVASQSQRWKSAAAAEASDSVVLQQQHGGASATDSPRSRSTADPDGVDGCCSPP